MGAVESKSYSVISIEPLADTAGTCALQFTVLPRRPGAQNLASIVVSVEERHGSYHRALPPEAESKVVSLRVSLRNRVSRSRRPKQYSLSHVARSRRPVNCKLSAQSSWPCLKYPSRVNPHQSVERSDLSNKGSSSEQYRSRGALIRITERRYLGSVRLLSGSAHGGRDEYVDWDH